MEGERRELAAGGYEFARRRLTKSRDRVIAGVCGGLVEHFGWDVTLF